MCTSALPNFTQMGLEVRKFRLGIKLMYALKLDVTVTEPILKELELSGQVF